MSQEIELTASSVTPLSHAQQVSIRTRLRALVVATACACWIAGAMVLAATSSVFGVAIISFTVALAGLSCVGLAIAGRIALQMQEFTERLTVAVGQRTGEALNIPDGAPAELGHIAAAFEALRARLAKSQRHVRRLAFFDPITDLPNQEQFLRQSRTRFAKAAPGGEGPCGAIVLLTLTRFSQLEDTYGQDVAQEILAIAGRRIAGAARTADQVLRRIAGATEPTMCARLGGAEFGLLVPTLEAPADAGRFAQMVVAVLAQPVEWRGQRMALDCSSGIAIIGRDTLDADSGVRQARLAARSARADGRPIKYYTRALDRTASARLVLERDMREALDKDQFRAFFQPKIDLGSGQIVGAEALARWVRPEGAAVGPGVFIPAAEENGLIGKIADAILADACRQGAAWAAAGVKQKIAVNVSALQFSDDRFPQRVAQAVEAAGLAPDLLELEITESVAMTNTDRVLQLIGPLREQGVSFAIDDFGTGHSSLASLSRLPFDVLKIDQSFVRGLRQDRHAPAIVETILAMAASLNFCTVAEGVETEEEAQFLRLRGCELAQGYLFGAAVAPDEFARMIGARAKALRHAGAA